MASIRQHHGKYQARYYDPSGKLRSKSFARKSDARAFLAATETDKRRGEWIDPRLAELPFGDWAEQCLEGRLHLRASSRVRDESYLRNHVLPVFGHIALGRITTVEVQAWIRALSQVKGLAPRTVRECYRILGGIMAQAATARLVAESPCRGISLPRVERQEQRYLTAEEVERLAQAINPSHRALVYSAVYLGCRWGELVGLRRSNLDLLRRRVSIIATMEEVRGRLTYVPETKTSAGRRSLSIPPFLVEFLAWHLTQSESEYVFTGHNGAIIQRGNFRTRQWLPAVERAGLSPLRFHDLRHTCASLLIAQGAHPKEIQSRLGHASITTTLDRYGHLFPSLDERLTEGLESAYQTAKAKTNVAQTWPNGPSEVIDLASQAEKKAR